MPLDGGEGDLVIYDSEDPDAALDRVELTDDESNAIAEILGAPQMVVQLSSLQKQAEGLLVEQVPDRRVRHGGRNCRRIAGTAARAVRRRVLRVLRLSTKPGLLLGVLPLALLLMVVCSMTKVTTGYVAARRSRIARRGRWRAAVALIRRGEFSIVVAALAVGAGAEAQLGPLTARFVLLTIAVGAVVSRLPDRLRPQAGHA